MQTANTPAHEPIHLTQFAHGGGCGCKIAPGLLREILARAPQGIVPPELMVGTETSDDAAVYRLNESQALVATTDFFTPSWMIHSILVALQRPMRSRISMPWGVADSGAGSCRHADHQAPARGDRAHSRRRCQHLPRGGHSDCRRAFD